MEAARGMDIWPWWTYAASQAAEHGRNYLEEQDEAVIDGILRVEFALVVASVNFKIQPSALISQL